MERLKNASFHSEIVRVVITLRTPSGMGSNAMLGESPSKKRLARLSTINPSTARATSPTATRRSFLATTKNTSSSSERINVLDPERSPATVIKRSQPLRAFDCAAKSEHPSISIQSARAITTPSAFGSLKVLEMRLILVQNSV